MVVLAYADGDPVAPLELQQPAKVSFSSLRKV
jgi:hypothetical protein